MDLGQGAPLHAQTPKMPGSAKYPAERGFFNHGFELPQTRQATCYDHPGKSASGSSVGLCPTDLVQMRILRSGDVTELGQDALGLDPHQLVIALVVDDGDDPTD
jgi:hypothetical protein